MDFDGGKVHDRRGLCTVCLRRGSPIAEDAAAGFVEAFTAEFGHFHSARLDPPLPAVPEGRGLGQGHRRGRAEPTPAVQGQI